jgi:hypothetical protein
LRFFEEKRDSFESQKRGLATPTRISCYAEVRKRTETKV